MMRRMVAALTQQALRHQQAGSFFDSACRLPGSAASCWCPTPLGQEAWPSVGTSTWQHARSITTSAGLGDYYSVLGIKKDSTDQEIKKAYYQLAKKYHPDTNKDNADAAKRFQEVTKAYETLRDPEKRRMYDQVGHENMERMERSGGAEQDFSGGFQGGGFPFNQFTQDIFEQFFRGGAGGGGFGNMFTRMATQPISISFMEAVQGTSRRLEVGGVMGMPSQAVDVKIPAGVDTGDHVEVEVGPKGRGRVGIRLAIPIQVESHPTFRREGADLYVDADVPLHVALLGANIQVPTLDSKVQVAVPACSQHGDKLRLRGLGVYNARRGAKGDQYVRLNVIMPKDLTAKQKDLLAQFVEEEENKKKKKGFF